MRCEVNVWGALLSCLCGVSGINMTLRVPNVLAARVSVRRGFRGFRV